MAYKKIAVASTVFLVIVALLAGAGFIIHGAVADRYHESKIVFEMEDAVGDDYGPGSYKYPTDSIFDPKAGHFDLEKFMVWSEGGNYHFDLQLGKVTNPWGAAEGFSHQICQIYIADGSENGKIETFKEGARIQFSPQYPWTSFIKVVSFGKTAVYAASEPDTSEGKSKGIKASLQEDNKTIRVTVPRAHLSGDPKKWAYYVLVGSQDGSGPDNYRPVLANTSQWNFGGGSNTRFHPNVIDMLAADKGARSQEQLLKSYDQGRGRLALLYPVGPAEYSSTLWDNFLEYFEAVFLKYDINL